MSSHTQQIILNIEDMAYGGEGVGRHEGRVFFVPGTVPGDQVSVKIVKAHARHVEARLDELIKSSAYRREAPCSVFGQCGGCQWQHVTYEAQLQMKASIVRESLRRIGKIENPNVLPVIASPHEWHYRNRIQLKVNHQGELGFHAAKTNKVIPIRECLIADKRLNEKIPSLQKQISSKKDEVEMVLTGDSHEPVKALKRGEFSFSQVNPEQNKRLIQHVLDNVFGNSHEAFSKKQTIVDVYAGSGNLTFPLATKAGQVIAIEKDKKAVERGVEKALLENQHHIAWEAANAEFALLKLYRKKVAVDVLVLDPPRSGAVDIMDLISLIKPRRVVYVSCNPTTLARDLRHLVKRFYNLTHVQPIDMFPQTYHVECVALLNLK